MSARNKAVCLSVHMYVCAMLICNICMEFYGLQGFFCILCLILFFNSPMGLIVVFSPLRNRIPRLYWGKSIPKGWELVNGRARS